MLRSFFPAPARAAGGVSNAQVRDLEASEDAVLDFSELTLGIRTGQLLSADGSSLPVPVLSKGVIETTSYVPRSFAQGLLHEATAEYQKATLAYKEHVQQLKDSYEQRLKDSQRAFESFVSSVKSKAQRHVEVQQQMRKQAEDGWRVQLEEQVGTNDELRDKLATMNLQHQELRRKSAEAHFQLAAVTNIHSRLKEKLARLAAEAAEKEESALKLHSDSQQEIKSGWLQDVQKQADEHAKVVQKQTEEHAVMTSQLKQFNEIEVSRLESMLAAVSAQHNSLQLSYCISEMVGEVERRCAPVVASLTVAAATTLDPVQASDADERDTIHITPKKPTTTVASQTDPLSNEQQQQQPPLSSLAETEEMQRGSHPDSTTLAPVADVIVASSVVAGAVESSANNLAAEIAAATAILEDQVHDLNVALEAAREREAKLEETKAFVANQLSQIVAEKRTDVLKALTDENDLLRNHVSEMNETLASFKSSATKAENKVNEFKLRAEQAEANVRSRDAAAMSSLPPGEELFRLRKDVAKLNEELINRSKAVTAGWDAAANADERYDIEITKAHDQGFKEGTSRVSKDLDRLNLSLEAKDIRIQELILQLGEYEVKAKESEQRVAEAEKRTADAALEVADTIAALGGSAGGSDGGGGGVSETEFDRLRGELDEAQEEIVTLQERVDELLAQVTISEQTIGVYEQLKSLNDSKGKASAAAAARSITPKRAPIMSPGGDAVGEAGGGGNSHLSEVLIAIKNALTKGSGLWKVNTPQKKDECLELYKETLEDCARQLAFPALLDPVKEVLAILGTSIDSNKWTPVLRKALEKLQADGKVPSNVRGESAAAGGASSSTIATPTSSAVAQGGEGSTVVRELEIELRSLRQQLTARAQREDELKKQLQKSGQGATGASLPDSLTGSILRRAQQAERQVETLKKQLRALAQPKVSTPGAPGPSFDATAVELRRCQRKIKALEEQLASGGGGIGSSADGSAGDRRMQILAEKQAAKKIKEQEATSKKELKTAETRATKAESALREAREALQPVQSERDDLKTRLKSMLSLGAEVETLRAEAASLQTVKEENERLSSDLARVSQALVTESALRKKYKNELEDLKGAIRVYARCRPMARYEIDRGCATVVNFKDENSLAVASSRGNKEFEFDAVYDPNSRQEQVFEDTRRLVESSLDGYNVCIFAYGQTGSGKTHTLTGSPELPGITPRVIDEIFRLIEFKSNCVITVRSYFLELYLDNLVDLYYLLDSKKAARSAGGAGAGGGGGGGGPTDLGPPKLEIKMDDKKMVFVRNSVVKEVGSAGELMSLFRDGNKERHTGATLMNAESSRSHSIFAILIESTDKTTKKTVMGKISLVDLAGSERADKTGATGERFKEGQAINKSLSALGNVISALSEGKKKNIPYRDNKLTMLMQDSLGGNAKTLMFVNISPADYNVDESVQSLNYAARVKKIVNSASKAIDSAEVARLKAIIRRLGGGAALVGDDGDAAGGGGGDVDDGGDAAGGGDDGGGGDEEEATPAAEEES